MFPADFAYARASSLEHALALLGTETAAGKDVKVIAGGQSLLPMMKLRLAVPELVIDIGGLAELKGVTTSGGTTRVGALTTYRELQRDPGITSAYPAITDALAVLADAQVRARGTIGGCVAHGDPAADLPAVLLALGAQVEVTGRAATRAVPLAGFLLDVYTTDLAPGELVTAITLPSGPPGQAYEKFEQPASHLPLAGVCAVAEVRDGTVTPVRVAVTGIAPRAFCFSPPAERLLPYPSPAPIVDAAGAGRPEWDPGIGAALAEAGLTALSDQHASGPFRVHLAGVLARRALMRAAARAATGTGAGSASVAGAGISDMAPRAGGRA
jgi:carbon-monoxide dehydrogenase medium subunit